MFNEFSRSEVGICSVSKNNSFQKTGNQLNSNRRISEKNGKLFTKIQICIITNHSKYTAKFTDNYY